MSRWFAHRLVVLMALIGAVTFGASSASAATCASAGAQGSAPAAWKTYCWLDFSDYNDAVARSASGQNFSFDLADGSQLQFTLNAASTAATAAADQPAPSWTGAAIGNSSFLNIPGRPILYMLNSGSRVDFTFSNITVNPPPGVSSVSAYAFVVADAESTDNAEFLEFGTNGSAWETLDAVPPTSGSQYPALTGVGSTIVRASGDGNTGSVGGFIFGTDTPTNVTATMQGAGLQGMMFAVRFASITLNKTITGARIDPADQFTFQITSTSSGTPLASGTTSGTGNGPFSAAVISTASGIPINLTEVMASGSASALSQYRPSLTCTNNNPGSPTTLPNNLQTTNYNFGSLAFGDAVECVFNNAAYPHISFEKQLAASGRIFDSDQFEIRIRQGSSTLANTITSGTGTTVTNGIIAPIQAVAGTSYRLDELSAGSTVLAQYTPTLSCTNDYGGSSSVVPTSLDIDFNLGMGDVVRCILTNTRNVTTGALILLKQSTVISDPINGTNNPKRIPGAIIRYSIEVKNLGSSPIDNNRIRIFDPLPPDVTYDASTPVQFIEGSTPSGLNSFNPSTRVSFSSQAGGGGPYNYDPNTSGFDSNVKGLRIRPRGIMDAASGVDQPSFTVTFEARVD